MCASTIQRSVRIPAGEAAAYGPVGRSQWLDVDWREHQRWLAVDGEMVNVIELGPEAAGATQPLVFVHGLSGCWANFLEQLPVLARDHRIVTLDLPGFGYSPMPSKKITISGYGRLLDALLGQLAIDAAALVGNSMGGFISAELAIAFPQRVERLVLISPAGISTREPLAPISPRLASRSPIPALTRAERILAASAAGLASRSDAVSRRARLRELTLSLAVRHAGRLPAPLVAEQLRGVGTPGFLDAFQAIIEYDFEERLKEIACPTLIVWGDHDRLVSVRDADVFASLIPDSRKVIFEDTGHMAMLERPAAFNALLRDFLAE
ncbi:MAG TPA: alpha/beta hydrolase [Solirubrobacteraceae bacterium]|nr:alpha/beta hydrolase [Solirubrobacteraceae bacterium]